MENGKTPSSKSQSIPGTIIRYLIEDLPPDIQPGCSLIFQFDKVSLTRTNVLSCLSQGLLMDN